MMPTYSVDCGDPNVSWIYTMIIKNLFEYQILYHYLCTQCQNIISAESFTILIYPIKGIFAPLYKSLDVATPKPCLAREKLPYKVVSRRFLTLCGIITGSLTAFFSRAFYSKRS